MGGPGDRHPGAGGRPPRHDAADRDRYGMTGRGYEAFDPDDLGGGPAPSGRGYGARPGGEPRYRSGTDAVDYDRGYGSARRGPYADHRDYQAKPDRGLYRGQGGAVEDADAHRTGRDQEPDYRGRGPRNYKRSDARISEDVHDRLTEDPHVDASEITVTVETGEVTLDGTVASRTMKRRAEDLSDAVSGVTHTQNNLRVVRHAEGGRTTFGEASGAREPGSTGREPPEEPAIGPRTAQHIGEAGTGHGSGRTAGER